jgi:hypothetical protein
MLTYFFNQQHLKRDLTPNVVVIKILNTSAAIRCAKQKTQIQWIEDEIKFNFIRKQKLNSNLLNA